MPALELGAEVVALAIRLRLRPQHTVKPAKMRRIIEAKVSQKAVPKRINTRTQIVNGINKPGPVIVLPPKPRSPIWFLK